MIITNKAAAKSAAKIFVNQLITKKIIEIHEQQNALGNFLSTNAKAQIALRKQLIGEAKGNATSLSFSAEAEALKDAHVPEEDIDATLAELPKNVLKEIEDEDSSFQEAEIPAEESFSSPEILAEVKAESFSLSITLNERQLAAKEMALSGKSFCLIGAAGTGKTTTQRSVAETLLLDSKLSTCDFKAPWGMGDRVTGPSIAFCAYTRRATANLRRAVHKLPALEEALKYNIMTIHQLLEYEPEFYDAINEKTGEMEQKFRFAPQRTGANPLRITHLIIEEASMLGLDLWEKLYDALPLGVQIIFIGDINQLPPVFGPSILNYALVQLPVIELTEVYRNQGIVLENAHNILGGKELTFNEKYQIVEGKNNHGQENQARILGDFFKRLHEAGEYDPERHMILSPWNKAGLGSDNMNKYISQFLGEKRNAQVHEIIAGFNKLYLAVGDKVMYNKMDGVITSITRNAQYFGKEPQLSGADLTRFGVRIIGKGNGNDIEDLDSFALTYENFSLDDLEKEKAERKLQASHMVTIRFNDTEIEETLSSAGDFGPQTFSLGYVLTVHKSQGSEWDKVFILLHKDHAVSLYRELLYTAATRARTEVVMIAKKQVIDKAIKTQRIKGSSLQDKIEYFNSGALSVQDVFCTK